jgi:hypothetical protein
MARPRIKVIKAMYKELPGAKIVDFEFSNYLEFFLRPEDKFKVLNSMDGYPFTIEEDYKTRYIIKKVPANLKMIKIFLPKRPAKSAQFYLDHYISTYKLKQVELVEFGYHVTLIEQRRRY